MTANASATHAQLRRPIDVIFVQPKHRYFVVLHNNIFWQLPRMNLSAASWQLKTKYTGNLSNIYVAKNQAITDAHLTQLRTLDLPSELHSMNALRFLTWWQANAYKWVQKINGTHKTQPLAQLPEKKPMPQQPPATKADSATKNTAVKQDDTSAIFDDLMQDLLAELDSMPSKK